ncbi:MAG: hypothetical protein ACFFEV_06255 [Candidatus Thorarchaeota archaeon]
MQEHQNALVAKKGSTKCAGANMGKPSLLNPVTPVLHQAIIVQSV